MLLGRIPIIPILGKVRVTATHNSIRRTTELFHYYDIDLRSDFEIEYRYKDLKTKLELIKDDSR